MKICGLKRTLGHDPSTIAPNADSLIDAMTDVVPDVRRYFGQQAGEVGSRILAGMLAAWAVGISDSLGLVRGFTPGASLMQS